MYLVVAVFNKENINDVLFDLYDNGIEGITVVDVVGKGSNGISESKVVDFFPKIKIEVVVSNEEYRDIVMECVRSNANDLGHGAGKMWWLPVGGVERIRTGEKDASALSSSNRDSKLKTSTANTTNLDTPAT